MSARFKHLAQRAAAVLVASTVVVLGAASLVQPAQAASSTVSVSKVSTGNGTLVTPKVTKSGKAKITSKSFKVTKGGKTVTTTSTAGKTIKVKAGKYTVKTTVKYKVGSKKKTYTKSSTVTVKTWNPSSMSKAEYDRITPGMTYRRGQGDRRRRWYSNQFYSEYEWDGETTVETGYEWSLDKPQVRDSLSVYFTNGVVGRRLSTSHYFAA